MKCEESHSSHEDALSTPDGKCECLLESFIITGYLFVHWRNVECAGDQLDKLNMLRSGTQNTIPWHLPPSLTKNVFQHSHWPYTSSTQLPLCIWLKCMRKNDGLFFLLNSLLYIATGPKTLMNSLLDKCGNVIMYRMKSSKLGKQFLVFPAQSLGSRI